jgi:hypothetical protein
METWQQISDDEFSQLFAEQYAELDSDERKLLDQYRVGPCKAVVRRSEEAGDEPVFVVARTKDGVLYFDDVEYGFNIAGIDETNRITTPGGSQNTLKQAINEWFPVRQ